MTLRKVRPGSFARIVIERSNSGTADANFSSIAGKRLVAANAKRHRSTTSPLRPDDKEKEFCFAQRDGSSSRLKYLRRPTYLLDKVHPRLHYAPNKKPGALCPRVNQLDCNPRQCFFSPSWSSPRNESFHRYLNSFVPFSRRRSARELGRGGTEEAEGTTDAFGGTILKITMQAY